MGNPAMGRFPVVVFHHANPYDFREYEYLIDLLQSSGFIVLNVSTNGPPPGAAFSAQDAIEAEICALRFLYFDSGLEGGATCDVVLAGHSKGGLVAQNMPLEIRLDPSLVELNPVAVVLLASSANDNPIVVEDYVPEDAVPLLVLGSANDNDVPGQVLPSYDRTAVELEHSPPEAQPSAYRGAVWIYDLFHTEFGGLAGGTAKGRAITTAYVERFLRWQVFADGSERPFLVGEAIPPEVLLPAFWDTLPAYDQLSDPAVCGATANQNEQSCTQARCAWDGAACQQLPVLLTSFTIDNRSEPGRRQLAELFEVPDSSLFQTPGGVVAVTLGDASITQGVGLDNTHATNMAFVETVDESGGPEGVARFDVATVDASTASHASMRLGARTRVIEDLISSPQVCDPVFSEALQLEVVIGDGNNSSDPVALDPLIPQQTDIIPFTAGEECRSNLFLHTQRIPMSEICDAGFVDTENITQWSFVVPNAVEQRDEFVVDTLEFSSSPADVAAFGTCPQTTALWECVTESTFLPHRIACTAAPVSGACPLGAQQVEYLTVPTVPSEWGGPHSGWVVHMPPGYSDDPFNPTAELQAAMDHRCELACEREFMGSPEVTADCTAATAFSSVARISSPSQGPLRRIRPDRRDGSGFFAAQALGCSLEDNCCLAFDENACPSSAFRTTPAAFPIGAAQEYVFDIDSTTSELRVDANGTSDSVKLHGSLGFSECTGGNDSTPCPFALTSLEAKSIGSIKVPVTCPNGSVVNRTLYNLDVHLRQPAFGIAEMGTDHVGFPAGSIVLEASFRQNAQTWNVGGPTEIDLELTASPTSFSALQIPVHGEMPACWGQEGIPAVGEFDLILDVGAGPVESPPSITIDVPTTVSCPSVVNLAATVADPDGDDDTVVWYVDDVRIASGTSSLTFTEAHTLRAVAFDSRGAATTATREVDCM